MGKTFLSAISLLLLFTACTKDEVLVEKPTAPAEDPYKNEFTACSCQVETHQGGPIEFIKAEINGIPVCADMKGIFGDSFDNMLKYGRILRRTDTTYYDNLYMIRYTRDNKFQVAIFLENSHARTKTYPYELPRANPEFCEIGELQFTNQQKITPVMCSWCTNNDWHYYAPFFSGGVKLIADSYQNGYFEGRFSGTIRTGSGRVATVTNGSFKIKLTEIYMDVVVP